MMYGADMSTLMDIFSSNGSVTWLGMRPKRRSEVIVVSEVEADEDRGLLGDHYSSKSKNRQVTLIQAEHLNAVASITGKKEINPSLTRRNIVVSGINLLALKGRRIKIGGVVLQYTGECHPCSRMEENLGRGGYNAMRGHGGITAMVLQGGTIKVGDSVEPGEKI